jgi:tetratricopeptide (TPR) repeat protein
MHSEYKDKQSTFNGFLGMVSFAKWAFTQDWTISFFLNRRLTIEFGPTLDSTETSEYEMALERLQRSINLDPSNDTFLYFLCLLQLENHRGPAALGAIQHFCKLNPHNPNGFLYQAKILLSMDRPDLVPAEIAAWLRVLDLDPANDIAFAAILQHFRAQRISCATLLLVLVNRIDVSISASESVPVWRLMAAVLAARRKALLANNFQTAGSQLEQTTLMNRFYTWRQRYWSLEALRMQQEEMNTVGRILILTCALLVLGKTQYSLHAVCTLAETSMTDLHFHTSAFGIAPLLREHLTDVAKLKAIKRDLKRGGKFRSRSIRADTKLENRQFFDPNASVNADPEYPPVQDAPAQPSRPRIHVPRRKPNSRSRSIAENQDENSSVKVNPRKLYEPVHLTGRNISRERERELERLKRTLEELAEPLPEPEAKRHKPKETADNSME